MQLLIGIGEYLGTVLMLNVFGEIASLVPLALKYFFYFIQ